MKTENKKRGISLIVLAVGIAVVAIIGVVAVLVIKPKEKVPETNNVTQGQPTINEESEIETKYEETIVEQPVEEKEIFETRLNDGNLFISLYNGNAEEVTIPATIDGKAVYGVSGSAFESNKTIKKVVFEDGIKHIGGSSFYWCENLKEVKLPETLEVLGANAFFCCFSLEKIVIPASVKKFGMGVFQSCSNLKEVIFEGNPTEYDASVFEGTSIESITIPEGMKNLYSDTLGNCKNLKTVYLPSTLTYINEYAFYESPNVTIIANKGSLAETFAKERGIPFKAK